MRAYSGIYITCNWGTQTSQDTIAGIPSLTNQSGNDGRGLDFNLNNILDQCWTVPKTWHTSPWWAKPIPLPFNPLVLPDVDRPIGSHHRFCNSGYLSMVTFIYLTDRCQISTSVWHHHFCLYWLPGHWELRGTDWITEPANEGQQSVTIAWSCIIGNLSSHWLMTFRNKVLTAYTCDQWSGMLPAKCWKWAST